MKNLTIIAIALMSFTACTIVRQDEVAVKRTLGRIKEKIFTPGPVFYNPFLSRVIKTPIRTINLATNLGLPSREGLTVQAEISILYRLKQDKLITVIQNVGLDFENILIFPVFRSAAADICAKFDAKDMHSSKRSEIEKQIKERMMSILEPKGFEIEEVLLKSIILPAGLSKAIEEKLNSEQEAQRMEFVKDREKREAERKIIMANGDKQARIIAAEGLREQTEIEARGKAFALQMEAEGQKKANDLLNSNITANILKMKSIEAFLELSKSPNSKIIFTDGKTPFLSVPESK
jgi:regulator of protease activity HflC (stomatin/prohibitin superfamily)